MLHKVLLPNVFGARNLNEPSYSVMLFSNGPWLSLEVILIDAK